MILVSSLTCIADCHSVIANSTTRWRQSNKFFKSYTASRASYHRVFFSVVLWDGDVVVGDFRLICCRLLSVPHDVVQVWKVMIQVDSFKAETSVSPAGQL